ncbi:MAG: hypothetical protein SH820_10385 [Xanthomonadales bacterium]|nr:hypothetical protein [Xanthomonadales bacterium]
MKWKAAKWFEWNFLALLLLVATPTLADELQTHNVILLTLDGVRIQEVFAGLDETIAVHDEKKVYSEIATGRERYGQGSAEQKRAALMPNFWQQLAPQGFVLGNPQYGNHVKVQNNMLWSTPGYTEIMSGGPKPDVTDESNPRIPYRTVLEVAREKLGLGFGEVAQFGSSDTYKLTAASRDDAFVMVGNYDGVPAPFGNEQMDHLAGLRRQVMGLWEEGSNDVLTFHLAQAYLQKNQPRVMWLALLNSDDWAHEDRYDRYLDYLHLADELIGELWTTLQSSNAYRDKTTLIITTDHGRGLQGSDWSEHDISIPGSEDIWLAVIGPNTPDVGEVKTPGTVYQGQVAATLLQYLGVDYRELGPNVLPPVDLAEAAPDL